jgi:hypothetical protein
MSPALESRRVPPTPLTIHTGDPQSEIILLDSRGRLLERALGPSRMFPVEPGIYRVKVLTGPEYQEKSIVAAGAPLDLNFAQVAFASPVPLAGTTTSHEYHQAAADTQSRIVHVADGNGSSLFFLVRDWTPGPVTPTPRVTGNPAEGLSLHEVFAVGERKICDLAAAGVHNAMGDPWAACTVAVEPGTYELRLALPGGEVLSQSVVASPGRQTQSFVFMRRYTSDGDPLWRADLSRTSMLLGQEMGGFSPSESTLRAAELALMALATRRPLGPGEAARPLMPAEMRTLLREKFVDPILGIYGAHLLLMESPVDIDLFSEVVRNLRLLLGRHPDVEALSLRAVGVPPPAPFEHPPMLRPSWSLVVDASVESPGLMTDAMAARNTQEFSDGPWYIWRALPEAGSTEADSDGAFGLSEIEAALAENLGVMKRVRERKRRLAERSGEMSRDTELAGPQAFGDLMVAAEMDIAPVEDEDEEVEIDAARMRAIATRFGMPSGQLRRTLSTLEAKLGLSPDVPNLRFLLK